MQIVKVSLEGLVGEGGKVCLSKDELKQRLTRKELKNLKSYLGTFLNVGNYIIPFFTVPFLKKKNAILDMDEFGQSSALHNCFHFFVPHVHYDGRGPPIRMMRKPHSIGILY